MSFQEKAQHQISQIDKEVCVHMQISTQSKPFSLDISLPVFVYIAYYKILWLGIAK